MGIFDGYVLRSPRVAPSNSSVATEPDNGVIRDVRELPAGWGAATPGSPLVVDLFADQYRTAFLDVEGGGTTEYLIWAANSSQLALVGDVTWYVEQGLAVPTKGTETVGAYDDGTLRLVVMDEGGRDVGRVYAIAIARGDVTYDDDGWDPANPLQRLGGTPYLVFQPGVGDQNAAGVVTFDGAFTALMGGGFSEERGDRVVSIRYVVAPARFWWTRNDKFNTRFGWDGTVQKWKPYRGSAPKDVGELLFDEQYQLSPRPDNLVVGDFLPGNGVVGNWDTYAMLRVGPDAGATSQPIAPDGTFDGVKVVADDQVEGEYSFTGADATLSGVVGEKTGKLQINPAFTTEYAGLHIWYSYKGFRKAEGGYVGDLRAAVMEPLFISPIPAPTDHPFIKLGNRRPLEVLLRDDEASLGAPSEGECQIALSTGRLVLSAADIEKADPTSPNFSKHFLGEGVYYDGVAMNAIEQPTRAPVQLVDSGGNFTAVDTSNDLYVLDSTIFSEDTEALGVGYGEYRGLGSSGIIHQPDGTGVLPYNAPTPSADPPVRVGGDTLPVAPPLPDAMGLVRRISVGTGDLILFSRSGAVIEVEVVRYASDVPANPNDVPGGKAIMSQEAVALGARRGSLIQINAEDRKRFKGEKVYFLQAVLTPAFYTDETRITSRLPEPFMFEGGEKLEYAINGVHFTWTAPAGTYKAAQVAASIGNNTLAVGDRIVLNGLGQKVEVGWNTLVEESALPILGFLPGWQVEEARPNWMPDSGISMGLYRSSINLDRSLADPDYTDKARVEDVEIQASVQETPFVFFDQPPLQDIAGYDEGIFFNLRTTVVQQGRAQIVDKRLEHFVDIQHEFGAKKFNWLDEGSVTQQVQQARTSLALGNSAVISESLLEAVGGGLWVSDDGGPLVRQVEGTDFLLPEDGLPGFAQLVVVYGARKLYGAQGTFTAAGTTFTITDGVDFVGVVNPGDRLKLSKGDSAGHYIVASVTGPTHLEVEQPFPADSGRPTAWELFEGMSPATTDYDPSVLGDVVYTEFSHLPEETFQVRVLSPLGVLPSSGLGLPSGIVYQADMAEALASGRPISVRFGTVAPSASTVSTLSSLGRSSLGTMANNSLYVPAGDYFDEDKFNLRIGTQTFENGVGLNSVPNEVSFSPDPGGGAGIEYAADTRLLKFGSQVLSDYEGSAVWYIEVFRSGVLTPTGEAFYDPDNGQVMIGQNDIIMHLGRTVYFVEQMITEGQQDAAISPIAGSVSFRKPRNPGQIVEFEYWLADAEGRRVGTVDDKTIEFLPLFVQRETALRISDSEFLLNYTGTHVVDSRIEPIVFVGPTQQNYGTNDFTVEENPVYPGALSLKFNRNLPSWVEVLGTYAIFDALGGEKAYTASQRPLYRPPFYIKAGVDYFDIRSDRTGDFEAGQMLRLGADCLYIQDVTYYPAVDATKVHIFPPTASGRELGSRSPGNDALALLTSKPITTVVDPDGAALATTADAGFMVDLDGYEFEPVTKDQNFLIAYGDLTRVLTPNSLVTSVVVPGHIMEISGQPFTVAGASVNEDGTRTRVTFTAPFKAAITDMSRVTVKASYRPVYPPSVRTFLGVGPVVESKGVDVVLFDGTSPGQSLRKSVEYEIDANTGVVKLLEPFQDALQPGQKVMVYFTQQKVLTPFLRLQEVVLPRYKADYLFNTIPSEENGLLDASLTATYTFESPDCFYFRVMPLQSFMGEAAEEAADEMKALEPSSGPQLVVLGGSDNWEQGRFGLRGDRRHLLDKDRSARTFLDFYNQGIVYFEQVQEAIDGSRIGDRDGKFRFFVGHGLDYAPPGYEDDVSGYLNPLNAWGKVFDSQDTTRDIWFDNANDPLVIPAGATMAQGTLTGTPLSPSTLGGLIRAQKLVIQNDIDDLVLLGPGAAYTRRTTTFPFFVSMRQGVYSDLTSPSKLSRLFPTEARAFFTLMPGALSDVENGDVGVYTYGRVNPVTGERESTYNAQIGAVSNPVLGIISNLTEKNLGKRLPRTRVWAYYPDGTPAGWPGVGTPNPCLVVSQVPFDELPLNNDSFPDIAQLLSQGGTVPDAEAGHPEMSLPGFVQGDQVALGTPDGRKYSAYFRQLVDIFGTGTFVYTGVFVESVIDGCILTFQDGNGNPIAAANNLLIGTSVDSGIPWGDFEVERADTIFAIPPVGVITAPATDPPTIEELGAFAALSPSYRNGTDLLIQADGTILDKTLPSRNDPVAFGLKEMLGQNVPTPMSHLEGSVSFRYTETDPVNFPALNGETLDDSGDVQIPYLKATGTELERLDYVHNTFGAIFAYPDEILAQDGEVILAATATQPPATLLSTVDFTAPTNPARAWDLLLIEVDPAASASYQGIQSVGAVSWDGTYTSIEPPRFITQTAKGSPLQYVLGNYAVHTTPGLYPMDPQAVPGLLSGVQFADDYSNSQFVLSMQSLLTAGVIFTLNDEAVPGTGNLNDILAASADNQIIIEVIFRTDVNINPATWPAAPVLPGNSIFRLIVTSADVTVEEPGLPPTTYPHGGAVFGNFTPGIVPGEPAPVSVATELHLLISGIVGAPTGILPLAAAPGFENQWYIPYSIEDPGGPDERNVGLYPYEFAISVDTDSGAAAFSDTAWCDPDRLTFRENLDFRLARPRGYRHPDPAGAQPAYDTSLSIEGITIGGLTNTALPSVYNGGIAFTFLPRTPSTEFLLGTADWAAPEGYLKVMGFEGDGNDPLDFTGLTFSVAASTNTVGAMTIGDGVGEAGGYHILPADPGDIDEGLIEAGDLVVVDRADDADLATDKAGAYLVRYYQPVDNPGDNYRNCAPEAQLIFPEVVSYDGATTLVISGDVVPLAPSLIFIALNVDLLANADIAVFRRGVIIATVMMVTPAGDNYELALAPGSVSWADGTAVADPSTLMLDGRQVSFLGATGLATVNIRFRGGDLADNNSVVGYDGVLPGPSAAVEGLEHLNVITGNGNIAFSFGGAPGITVAAPAPGSDNVQPVAPAAHTNSTFDPTNDAPVYDHVVRELVFGLSPASGALLNDPNNHVPGGPIQAVVLPGTRIVADDSAGTDGFYAEGGIFLEPSFPLTMGILNPATGPKVVDAVRNYLAVGMRTPGTPDDVHYEVRRIRRFHEVSKLVRQDLEPLRYVYEIRYGTLTNYTTNDQQYGILTADDGTHLGLFDDPDVNINPGDIVRVLNSDGQVVDQAFISTVEDGTTLRLRAPGLVTEPVGGETFQVFLRQAPVPQEQSYQQLLELITDEEIHRTTADRTDPDPTNWTGGYVPEAVATAAWDTLSNVLYDDTPGFVGFDVLGVQKGDFVVIDPAGLLPAPVEERGVWAQGDFGAPSRAAHLDGATSPLDDNRGFYRVTKVHADHLEVTGVSLFTGEAGAPVLGAEGNADTEYAFYPVISGSLLSSTGAEGQNDLRPTAKARAGSYIDDADPVFSANSIRPFSYRIIRSVSLASQEMVETVLAFRERMLSLIEFLTVARSGGLYWDFQNELHIEDIGDPVDVFGNPGLLPNATLAEVIGNLDMAPFFNTRSCLSVLDRRFWVRDNKLDTYGPDPANPYGYITPPVGAFPAANGPYTAYTGAGQVVRPLLRDYVSLVLDKRDQLRLSRFVWLTYRVNQEKGTLAKIRRFDAELPKRREEKRRALLLQKSTEGLL